MSDDKLPVSDAEWRDKLEPDSFRVLREEATERPFSSPLNDEHRDGKFICAGCGNELFDSSGKFNSGTGWPSFFEAIDGSVDVKTDRTLLMTRTEYHCARCGGHQGHLFDDGPAPSGKRFCNNGVALRFKPSDDDQA
jgi:peptide-methionine (R)-S-oxide reductase